MGQREKIVQVMQSWIGKKASDGSHKEIIDIYNGEKPLARGYSLKYTDAWCEGTVSAAAITAGIPRSIFPREVGCGEAVKQWQGLGVWVEDDSWVPRYGDVIFYDWTDGADYATTDNKNPPAHVGIVEKCDGKTITIIEGNKSNAVARRDVVVNGRYIRGFAAPKYIEDPPVITPTIPAVPTPDKPDGWAVAACGKAVEKRVLVPDVSPDYWHRPINRQELIAVLDRLKLL